VKDELPTNKIAWVGGGVIESWCSKAFISDQNGGAVCAEVEICNINNRKTDINSFCITLIV
jgi:hypothetical protein